MDDREYALKLDEQVEKFLELKHKLSFFVVGGALATIAFTVNFATDNLAKISGGVVPYLLAVGCLAGLIAIAVALFALNQEVESFREHLRVRHSGKTWESLSADQQERWNRLNQNARTADRHAFAMLLVSIWLQACGFLVVVIS